MRDPHHVVVLGAGFGGLTFCRAFRHPRARITVVDRQNHHLFQPLLYQVAAAGLAAPDIAEPVRSILSRRPDISVLLDSVVGIDVTERAITLQRSTLHYDHLVFALGGVTSYFGHPEWQEFAPGLKSLDDALRIRRDVLLAFERAECEPDPEARRRLMTLVVIGGGPTGVELAGAFAELARHVLRRDFRRIHSPDARVILVEAGARVLSHFPPSLSASAHRQLERLGVEILTNAPVRNLQSGRVDLANGTALHAATIVWAAGVMAHPLTQQLGAELDRSGRVKVAPDLSLPSHREVFVIGDAALVLGPDGKPVPGVSPAAMQMARHTAKLIQSDLDSATAPTHSRQAFGYRDQGSMATIGRSAAVAKLGAMEFSGFPAWLTWLLVHLVFLIGFDNKLVVLVQWAYAYFTYKRGARIVTTTGEPSSSPAQLTAR